MSTLEGPKALVFPIVMAQAYGQGSTMQRVRALSLAKPSYPSIVYSSPACSLILIPSSLILWFLADFISFFKSLFNFPGCLSFLWSSLEHKPLQLKLVMDSVPL